MPSTYDSGYHHHHNTRVRRKPPPAFPYSSRYPHPDPSDPFAPLPALRERARSSNVALGNTLDDPYASHTGHSQHNNPTVEAGNSHYLLTADHSRQSSARDITYPLPSSSHFSPAYSHSQSPVRVVESSTTTTPNSKPNRPWLGLASGYLSDHSKPSRPPRSRTRPPRDSTSYFSDVDVPSDGHHLHPSHTTYANYMNNPKLALSPELLPQVPNPRDTIVQASVSASAFTDAPRASSSATIRQQSQPRDQQHRESYQFRRRSQSVFVLPQQSQLIDTPATSSAPAPVSAPSNITANGNAVDEHQRSDTPPPPAPPRADPSRQYTYDERQSHGYLFGECRLDLNNSPEYRHEHGQLSQDRRGRSQQQQQQRQQQQSRHRTRTSTSSQSGSSTHSVNTRSRHPTPPMTPDDTLSTSSSPTRDLSMSGIRSVRTGRSMSISPPMLLRDLPPPSSLSSSKPIPMPLQTNNNICIEQEEHRVFLTSTPVQVQSTPACIHSSDFPILLPPPSPPSPPPSPSPTTHAPSSSHSHSHVSMSSHAHPSSLTSYTTHITQSTQTMHTTHTSSTSSAHAAISHMRHAESEPEISTPARTTLAAAAVVEKRRGRTGSFEELKRRLRRTSLTGAGGTGVRGKKISNPSPIMVPGRKPSFASDSSISVGHGATTCTSGAGMGLTRASPQQSSHIVQGASSGSKFSKFLTPRPKKSLSHVNLALKPLPNMSIGPTTAAPSTNVSSASNVGIGLDTPEVRIEMPREVVVQEVQMRTREVEKVRDVGKAKEIPSGNAMGLQVERPREVEPKRSRDVVKRVAPAIAASPPVQPVSGPRSGQSLVKRPPPIQVPGPYQVAQRTIIVETATPGESSSEDEFAFSTLIALRELLSPTPFHCPLDENHLHSQDRASLLVHRDPSPAPESPLPPLPPPTPPLPAQEARKASASVQRQPPEKKSIPTQRQNTIPAQRIPQPVRHRSESPHLTSPTPARSESPNVKRSISPKPPRPISPVPPRSESPLPPMSNPKHTMAVIPPRGSSLAIHTHQTQTQSHPAPVPYRGPAPLPISPPHRTASEIATPQIIPASQIISNSQILPAPLLPVRVQPQAVATRVRSPTPTGPHGSCEDLVLPPVRPQTRRNEAREEEREVREIRSGVQRMKETREPNREGRRESPSPVEQRSQQQQQQRRKDLREEERAPSPLVDTPQQQQKRKGSREEERDSPSSNIHRSQQQQQRKKDSKEEKERESPVTSEYLPVAQLRPRGASVSKQATNQSATIARRPPPQIQTQSQTQSKARPQSPEPAQLHQSRTRPQSPEPAPLQSRVRPQSPEPTQHQSRMRPQSPEPSPAVRSRSPELVRSPAVERAHPESPLPPRPTSPMSPQGVRRQRTTQSTPALAISSPSPITRSHGYPPPKSQSYTSHQSSRALRLNGAVSTRRGLEFDETALVTREQLSRAASLVVIAQNGLRVPFGDLFKDRKTIVLFIRHFWCAMDQDYMHSISKLVDTDAVRRAGIDVVIIGNGSPGMIKSYRHIYRTPFSLYTDPTLSLHSALGMTLRSNDPGPDSERGAYVRHGLVGGIAMVVRNALRVGMPVWEKGGDAMQLGGEFIFGPGFMCSYTHRMKTTRSHAPILEVMSIAGVQTYVRGPDGTARSAFTPEEDEEQWMENRRRSLARMRSKRERRRHGHDGRWCEDDDCDPAYDSDTETGSMTGSWGFSGASARRPSADDETVEELPRITHTRRSDKKNPHHFHASNPDREQDSYNSLSYGKRDLWSQESTTALSRSGKYGRNVNEDGSYMLTHEVLAYSFGKA